jgi:hypothetical protein
VTYDFSNSRLRALALSSIWLVAYVGLFRSERSGFKVVSLASFKELRLGDDAGERSSENLRLLIGTYYSLFYENLRGFGESTVRVSSSCCCIERVFGFIINFFLILSGQQISLLINCPNLHPFTFLVAMHTPASLLASLNLSWGLQILVSLLLVKQCEPTKIVYQIQPTNTSVRNLLVVIARYTEHSESGSFATALQTEGSLHITIW